MESNAANAEQISGASAPSAVTIPSKPSENRSRLQMRSNAVVNRTLAHDITARDTAKTANAFHSGITR